MPHDGPWQVIVPVKPSARAKSRLQPPRGVDRATLAHAMARDTLASAATAVGACQVWLVSAEGSIRDFANGLGCRLVDDPCEGLNAAVSAGLTEAGGVGTRLAVLLGDLPSLRPEELRTALSRCAQHRVAAVADRHAEGTTLLTGIAVPLMPLFGPGSAGRHREQLGAVMVTGALPGLRCDVDDLDDLATATGIGLGAHTAAVLDDAARA